MKPEKIKIKRAGSWKSEAGVKVVANTYTSFYKKIFMETDFFFAFNTTPLPASDFLTLLAELR
ncbi:hypothetical protein [Chryseobacterium sp. 7]|uniref:hypothetical protein n=1 Tax=Chryseobacterium sp. 7 TaxID=2035214 RepID=UPI0011C45E51|nr:hypothetical protein [Chryseobacterium sp. 7]